MLYLVRCIQRNGEGVKTKYQGGGGDRQEEVGVGFCERRWENVSPRWGWDFVLKSFIL